MKFNQIEKAFFPPFYKRFEIINDNSYQGLINNNDSILFHEECFNWVNNNHF